jgi:hypothetical protein
LVVDVVGWEEVSWLKLIVCKECYNQYRYRPLSIGLRAMS